MAEDEEEEEDFAYFGSALEPLEEGQTTVKKPVPLQEQTVKDERGRYQRFHGAFTGGFSAGYFNSVGSKEGWAPSTFVSSRQQKAETQMFAPEHFMDEEDLQEHGIAPRGIVTRSSFASKATDAVQERARALASVAGPIPGASALEDLITLATVTVGVRLLRLMGWKEGQGLGPRVKRKAQRQYIEPAVRVYGCSLPDEELQQPQECEGEADLPEGLTFAPRDVVPMDFTPKDDRHGLGYSGIDPRRALCGSATLDPHTLVHTHPNPAHRLLEQAPATGHTRPGITGQAFGVGALEDEDDDIYSRDSLSRYDSVLNEEEPGDGLYGWTAPTPTPRGRGRGVCLQRGYVGKEMEGFTLGAATTKSIMVYPAPELPRDYRPVHHFGPAVTMGTASVALAQALGQSAGQLSGPAETHGRHQLNATQRRELLGESALAGPRSVFDLLTVEDKERLQEAQRAAGRLTSPPPCQLQTLPLALPSSCGPGQEPSGFKPFLKDPPKQQRYEQFVQSLRAGQSEALAGCLDPSMTEWEQGREREEFGLAAVLYRPHSASLASRFTHAKLSDNTDHVEVPQQQESDVQDKDAAVTMNMFGTLTRDKFEWHPEKLLCKRFNVPDPYPGSTNVGLLKVKRDKYSVFNFLTVPTVAAARSTVQPSGAQRAAKSSRVEGKRRSRWDVPAENMEEDGAGPAILASAPGDSTTPHGGEEPPACLPHDKADAEGEDSRPAMDLFKAVFASSSEERSSSSSSEDEDANQTEAPPEAEEAAQPSHETAPTRTLPGLVQQLGGGGGAGGTQPRPRSPQTPVGGEEFGPRLPPALVHGFPGAGSITVETPSKERERHSGGAANRDERRREKDSSSSQREEREQKKHKDRRKGKKQKKESKKKHKKHRVRRSATGGSVGREEPLTLQQRMKNVPLMFH